MCRALLSCSPLGQMRVCKPDPAPYVAKNLPSSLYNSRPELGIFHFPLPGVACLFGPCLLSDLSPVRGRAPAPIRSVIRAPFRMDRRRRSLLCGPGEQQIPVGFWRHPGWRGKRRSPDHCRHGTQLDRNSNGQ